MKDLYKEAVIDNIDNILYVNANTIAGAEATCDADLMAYARAAEYYMRVIADGIKRCRHHSEVMEQEIEEEKAGKKIKASADIGAVEDADKVPAGQHNKTINDTKNNIRHMLTLCSRDGSPLQDEINSVVQLDRYVNRMQKDLAEKRDKLKKLRMKRVAKE